MKTAAETPARLVFEDRPRALPAIVCGAGALCIAGAVRADPADIVGMGGMVATGVLALVTAWVFFPVRIIVFDRDAGLLVRESRRVGRVRTVATTLDSVRRATVQTDHTDDARTERLVVLTDVGPLPLESAYTTASRGEAVHTINAWLTGSG